MSSPWLMVSFAILAWWASTAIVLFLNHLPQRTFPWTFGLATVGVIALLAGSDFDQATSTGDALWAFCQAILVWAWLELGHFMGLVTGPSRTPCPPGSSGWRRFKLALMTSLYHELLVIFTGIALIVVAWEQPNQFAVLTFCTLWFMRWSAKLNLFFGVPNVNTEWIPQRVAYLASYIRRRPTNRWFPFFVGSALVVESLLIREVFAAGDRFIQAGYLLVATLMALAILEHFFMVLSFRETALWDWARRCAKRQT